MNVLSLFSGIGGLELGLERAGMTVVGQVEIDEFCRRVLAKHWPEVPRHDDVRTAPAWWASEPVRPRVDVVAGGFPCQGHSVAGKQLGTSDERWGWPWYRDVVAAVAPAWVLIENVPNLVRTGLLDVLQDLASLGFDAWWNRVPAAAMGAPHLRWRLFVVAAHTERGELRHEPGWGAGRVGPIRPSLDTMARHGLWPTPAASAADRGGRGDLHFMVTRGTTSRRRDWPTPTASRRSGLQSHGRNAILGQLNPTWLEWLMGFPPGWTDAEP